MVKNKKQIAAVPLQWIGPIRIHSDELEGEVSVPLATFETPLWPSTERGARISRLAGGIKAKVVKESMSRSVLLEAVDVQEAVNVVQELERHRSELMSVVASTSRFATLIDWHSEIVGSLLYLRFEIQSGDASGHNMVTKAADALIQWMLNHYPALKYVSISGNLCTDKKVSAINGILGRGKYVVAEITVPAALCKKQLRTTPQKIVDLNIKKNLIGSILAGGLRSANAHFANMLFASYLAFGQDVANIVEGSQGLVHAEVRNNDLYFSITLPNLIVGTVGNGKNLDFVQYNLEQVGCLEKRPTGVNARRLAIIIAATVLCGELSLLAAQTIPGELMRSHLTLERREHALTSEEKTHV